MSHDALSPRQFTHREVKRAVPGYNPAHLWLEDGLEHLHEHDSYTRKLIPVKSVNSTTPRLKAYEDTIIGSSARNVSNYADDMREGDAHKFPPVVVAPAGPKGEYDILDGMHRLQAAHRAEISHTVAYVRKRMVGEEK